MRPKKRVLAKRKSSVEQIRLIRPLSPLIRKLLAENSGMTLKQIRAALLKEKMVNRKTIVGERFSALVYKVRRTAKK